MEGSARPLLDFSGHKICGYFVVVGYVGSAL